MGDHVKLFATPMKVHKSLEQRLDATIHRLQSHILQIDRKLEALLQSASPFQVYRDLEERLQSYVTNVLRNLEERLQVITPHETHQAPEDRFHAFGAQTNTILNGTMQSYESLKTHQKREASAEDCVLHDSHRNARHEINDVGDLPVKHLNDHGAQLEGFGRRLKAESAECDMKFSELKSMLQSECVGWQKLLEVETSSKIHALREFG